MDEVLLYERIILEWKCPKCLADHELDCWESETCSINKGVIKCNECGKEVSYDIGG